MIFGRLFFREADERSYTAIPENWLTAFQTAIDIGGLSKGKSILVHAGARSVQLSKACSRVLFNP